MAKKKKHDYQEELFSFLETEPTEPEVTFPLCIKMEENGFQGKVSYFRYCGDGRYEQICESDNSISLSFGTTKLHEGDNDNIWLKILFFRAKYNHGGQSLITVEEFDKQVDLMINHNYTEYLAGRKYVDPNIAVVNRPERDISSSALNTGIEESELNTFEKSEEEPPF